MQYADPWPYKEHQETDSVLRKFLTDWVNMKPKEIQQLAKEHLRIDLD